MLTVHAAHRYTADLREHALNEAHRHLSEMADLGSLDMFLPKAGSGAAFDQEGAPALMLQLEVATAEVADTLVQAPWFRCLTRDAASWGAPVIDLSFDRCEVLHFPIPGHEAPPPRTATLSFVVRYYGPTADLAAFDRFYVENHPPILARVPGIRTVLCYLPTGWQSQGPVPDSRFILGNEVVFDDLEALNRALESDVLALLIADGKLFPEFGSNTHHAMQRERIYTGAGPPARP
jgi:uncharacterized protein (TIGR02118 family)